MLHQKRIKAIDKLLKKISFIIVIISFTIHILGFILLKETIGPVILAISIIPVLISAFFFLLKGGITSSILAVLINISLIYIYRNPAWEYIYTIPAILINSFILIMLGTIFGYILNLYYQLKTAKKEISILENIISMCSNCKKIEMMQNTWITFEDYIEDQSNAEITHGLCPECTKKLYPQSHK